MKSFSIIRTNTGLTTNIQLVVNTNYQLYMESFNSVPELSQTKYKHIKFNKDNYWDELIPHFFKDTPANIAFSVKYDNDAEIVYTDYNKQYDDIYYSGATNVSDLTHTEEFEYLAPLYIQKHSLPTNFFIFRLDGAGLINADKTNFNSEVLSKLKCIAAFDLTPSTPIGEFLKKNFTDNTNFPLAPFNLDVRDNEFSKFNGIEYESGGYISKSLFLNDYLVKEQTFFDFENFITDGYKNNKVVFPNILNLKFLFDDTPASPTELRKWSINRYMGFYMDSIDEIKTVTPYSPYTLRTDIIINNDNIFVDNNGNYIDPFIKGYIDTNTYYVEYLGSFYRVIKYTDSNNIQDPNITNIVNNNLTNNNSAIYKYKIIADISLENKELLLNKNIITFDNNYIKYDSNYNTIDFDILNFDKADLWLIEIDNKFHTLLKDDTKYYINSDYAFTVNNNKLKYYINSNNPDFTTTIKLDDLADDTSPMVFKIYRCNFTEIKDFDTSIVNTTFANHQYELYDNVNNTNEPKLYRNEIKSDTNSDTIEEFIFNGNIINIPSSSEYVANSEIFRVEENGSLSEIWRKNPTFAKWGYQNSLSTNDYPYRLNNSKLASEYNMTVNTSLTVPSRMDRNLDYFYTVNVDSINYVYHSLHVTDYTNPTTINPNFSFSLQNYLITSSFSSDYFQYFFTKKDYFLNGEIIKSNNKYSYFNTGDKIIPNSTVFNGIKFNIYDIENVYTEANTLKSITTKNNNNYNDWKFSILFTHNDYTLESDTEIINTLSWKIIDNWTSDKQYNTNDIVLYNNILYNVLNTNTVIDPNITPMYNSDYAIFSATTSTIFWNPNTTTYIVCDDAFGSVIYYENDYYMYINPNTAYADMWYSGYTYSINDLAIIDKEIYICTTASSFNNNPKYNPNIWSKSTYTPTPYYYNNGTNVILNTTAVSNTKWMTILEWNPLASYDYFQYVTYNNTVYVSVSTSNQNNTPDALSSTYWRRIYSLSPDTNYIYNNTFETNSILNMNNAYYMCTSNTNNSTLDNGIYIFINKKWKNILINIYNNDNTLPYIDNVTRDLLYNKLYTNLTAANFITAINDLENTHGFTNKLTYYIINEDDTIDKYNIDNIIQLPLIILAEDADMLQVEKDSLIIKTQTPNKNLYKSNFTLNGNNITFFNDTQNYNGKDLAVSINTKKSPPNYVENMNGIKNLTHYELYRMNGGYMPIFYNIELFKPIENESDLIGNYKFDTTLTDFGIIKERIFSKVSKTDILKFAKNKTIKSVYPMIDEFGYYFDDFYMFKSTWDTNFLIDILDNPFYKDNNSGKGQAGLTAPTNKNSKI